jgi:hypothetical protein
MIVSSLCFTLKSMLVTVSAVWSRGHGHHVCGCAAGGGLSAVAVPRWLALGSAGCAPSQVWPPLLCVVCAYCQVVPGLHPAFPTTLPRPVASNLSRSPHLPCPWSCMLYIPAVYAMLLDALT